LITQFTGIDPAGTEEQLSQTATAPWWSLFFFFLRVGIIEELIFRGFVISRAIDLGASKRLALFISTFLFILPHALFWPAPHLILVAFSSLAFGVIFIWKRDLLACIIAHIGFNVCGVIVLTLV
ncbi:MAG: CPBP family intramembrane metalloprotease, partial [Robiginitomaculum sp.]|nr:CPBP family intramembrane metalloprotease [Robiginitomaculum sp.]